MENTAENKEKAIAIYPTASKEVKTLLESIYGKEAFKTQELNHEKDIYKKLGCDPEKDSIVIDCFDEDQLKVVRAFVKKMRVCEAYNGSKKLKLSDKRYYNWYYKNSASSGLVFDISHYCDDYADLSSASRLSFADKKSLDDARAKFPDLDLDIIDLE